MNLYCADCNKRIRGMPIYPVFKVGPLQQSGTLIYMPGCPSLIKREGDKVFSRCGSQKIVKAK